MPTISVIMPVRNEAANIRRTLESLAAQNPPSGGFEVLVIDGRSDDDTVRILDECLADYPWLRVFDNPKRWSSAARNIGVEQSRGEYVVVIDGHCQITDPDHLRKLEVAFATSGADCVGRPQPLTCEEPTPFQRALRIGRESPLGHNPHSANFSTGSGFVEPDNVAVAYRREVFEWVGLFDESFDACEDVEFNTRVRQAGLTCWFTSEVAVEYKPRAGLKGLFRQMFRYGQGRSRLAKKFPQTMTWPSLIPPLWLLWLLFGAIACIAWSAVAWVWLPVLLAYGAILCVEAIRMAGLRREVWRVPAVIAVIHLGFGWGYVRELLRFGSALTVSRTLPARRPFQAVVK